tara:strand:+ start:21128 stop:21253 length:126 start_codon:yes stop_codon:yes gene_type:complete
MENVDDLTFPMHINLKLFDIMKIADVASDLKQKWMQIFKEY